MIIGFGTDLVDMRRIEELMGDHEARFVEKHFTDEERGLAESRRAVGRHIETYAKRYAAKEACAKALGTGIDKGVYLKDIGVVSGKNGAPSLVLSGGALEKLQAITPQGQEPRLHLSLSDDPPLAQAQVIIEAIG